MEMVKILKLGRFANLGFANLGFYIDVEESTID